MKITVQLTEARKSLHATLEAGDCDAKPQIAHWFEEAVQRIWQGMDDKEMNPDRRRRRFKRKNPSHFKGVTFDKDARA